MASEVTSFLSTLELAKPALNSRFTSISSPFGDDARGAAVAGCSVVSFVAGLSSQHKSDVLNSTLLAQLAADKQFARTDKPKEWYQYYLMTLGKIGWNTQSYDSSEVQDAGSYATVDTIVLLLLKAHLTDDALSVFQDSLEALKKNDRGLEIFNTQSSGFTTADFQVGTCVEVDKNVIFSIFYFDYSTKEEVTNVLWFKFGSEEVTFSQGYQNMILNEDVYGQVRMLVLEKLGQNAKDFIETLEI